MNEDIRRMEVELNIARAKAAKMELEMKILLRHEDIERMKDHIKLQDERITENEATLKSL